MTLDFPCELVTLVCLQFLAIVGQLQGWVDP